MRRTLAILIFVMLMSGDLVGCSTNPLNLIVPFAPHPEAQFEASPTTGVVPVTVQFTDLSSSDVDTWEWDLNGDGIIDSTLQNPEHTYTSPSTYTVSLKVSNFDGSDTETKSAYLQFSEVSPCSTLLGETLSVVITSANLAEATAVSLGGGITVNSFTIDNPDRITANITITGTSAAGPKDVSVTTPSSTRILSNSFTVFACKVDFDAAPVSWYRATAVQFTDRSKGEITGWAWDFNGDGIIDSTAQNPSYTYRRNGSYTVILTVSGPYGKDTLTKKDYIKVAGCST